MDPGALIEATLIEAYQASQKDRVDALIELQKGIFGLTLESVPELTSGLLQNPIVACKHREDGIAEIVNAVAAAAAVEMKSYEALWALVANLCGEKLENFGFRVVVACLERYIAHTMYFVLGLINRGVVTICPVFRFLKRMGPFKPGHLAAFFYFGPELMEYKREWYEEMWKTVHTSMTFGALRYNAQITAVMAPELPENLAEVDWEKHKAARSSGHGECKFFECLKNDDVEAFQKLVVDTDYNQGINYSMYEQFFKYPFTFTKTHDSVAVSQATLCHAVLLNGAEKCFKFMVVNCPNMNEMLANSAESLGGGASLEMVHHARDASIDFQNALVEAVRFHNSELVGWLLEDGKAQMTTKALVVAIQYANMEFFDSFMDYLRNEDGNVRDRLRERLADRSTLLHEIGKHNSIEMFKYVLSEMNGVDPSLPYESDIDQRTFLHWAAMTGSEEVIHFWCKCYGNHGLNAVDKCNLNPQHYAFISAVYPKPSTPSSEVAKPLYMYLKKRSNPGYSLAEDDNPDV